MKIFKKFQKYTEISGLIRDAGAFNNTQLIRILQTFISLVLLFVYLLQVASTPRQYLDSIFMTAVGCLVTISYMSTISKTVELFDYIDDIDQIVNERLKSPTSMAKYEKAHGLVETLTRVIQFVVVYASVPGFVLPKAIYSFYIYFVSDLGSDTFELPFPIWIPFEWKNPIGYSTAVALQFVIVAFTLQYFAIMMSLAIGSHLFGQLILNDLKGMIESYNDRNAAMPSREEMAQNFIKIIRFTQFKQTFFRFMDLYQVTLVVLFLGCTAAIGAAMLMTQQQLVQLHGDIDSIVLFESVFCGFWAIVLCFIACEFGQGISNSYDAIGYEINAFNWYLRISEMQMRKFFLITLMYVQKPLKCEFFGSISCSREQFRRVVYKGYNGFMVLRSIYK